MSDLKENQKIEQNISSFSKISSSFMELNSDLKDSPEITEKLEKLFKLFLESNQKINSEISSLIEQQKKTETAIAQLKEG